MARLTEAERFWAKVDKSGECWLWTAGKDRAGYGTFRLAGGRASRKAHQWAYADANGGPPPSGLELDHLCRVRACVRPDHLEPVTHVENMRRARTDVCPQGHPKEMYGGEWCCRICTRQRLNEWQQRKRREAGAVAGGPGAAQRAKTHCKRGHEFTPENTLTNDKGYRWCRECSRIRGAERRAAARSR